MIASMTGYGRGEVKKVGREITIEVRSLNNRFLDISIRLPKALSLMEEEVRNIIQQYLERGRVTVIINIKESEGDRTLEGNINEEVAQNYLKKLKELKNKLHLVGKIKLEHLLVFSDIFSSEVEEQIPKEIWDDIKKALIKALENLKQMRLSEGSELSKDLKKRIKIIDKSIRDIEKLSETKSDNELVKLRERVATLILPDSIDEGRLELEIALLASKLDVTEECIRMKSHNKLFLETINSEGAVGRKLNFLLQEMTREANTIGAKACVAQISHLVINIKEEIEKIREQVQNIE